MDMNQKGLGSEANEERQAAPLVPPVDIWEDNDGIMLKADLPGVAKESLAVGVDGETLTIEGAVTLGESAKLKDVYAEVRVARYRRSFVLGPDLDTEKIAASLKNGVLELRIPKLEAAKPRRIPVRVA
jgi:HSP20 family molecular chaperone IbpA